jgi:NitT/TauT family transport system permease protein
MSDVSTKARPSMQRTKRPAAIRLRLHVSPYVVSVLVAPAILLLWYWATAAELVAPILLPGPEAVWDATPRVIGASGFWTHFWRTTSEIVLGFALGGTIGFGLGLLLGASNTLRRAYLPFLSALQAVPKVILAPLIIAWFGFGIEGKVVQAGIACFYAVFITTLSGLELAEPQAIQLMRSFRASGWQIMRKVKIPSALPAIFGGLQLGATTAIIGAIVSEFVAADSGLGFLMLRYRSSFDTPAVWVLIFVFLLFGIVSYLLLWAAERKFVFWRRPEVARPDLERP